MKNFAGRNITLASLKATFDGIGTGGGVAWPLFGILFSTLGLAVGGTLTVVIGSTIGVLFLAVCLPVFYLSYKNSSKEEQTLRAKLNNDRKVFNEEIANYLQGIFEEYLCTLMSPNDVESEAFLDYITIKIRKDMKRTDNVFLNQLLTKMLADKWLLPNFVNEKILQKDSAPNIKQFISRFRGAVLQKPTPHTLLASAAFIGFVSTFGAITGSSSGILGLLTGMSVFAGLAAFPVLGWGILSVAVLLSFLVAGAFIYIANEKFQRRLQHSILKEAHQDLSAITIERNKSITIQHTSKKIIDAIHAIESPNPLENNDDEKKALNVLIPQLLSEGFNGSFFPSIDPIQSDAALNGQAYNNRPFT